MDAALGRHALVLGDREMGCATVGAATSLVGALLHHLIFSKTSGLYLVFLPRPLLDGKMGLENRKKIYKFLPNFST